MVKVVEFIHGLNLGGAETLVKNYALLLDPKEFDITVLCIEHFDSPYEKILADAGVKTIFIHDLMKTSQKKGILYKFLNHYLRFYYVKKVLHRLAPDVIHIHLSLNNYVCVAKPDKNTRLFYTQHNDVSRWKKSCPSDVKALKWLVRHYQTRLIAINEAIKQALNQLFEQEITTVLNNGIDQSLYHTPLNKAEKRRSLGIEENVFLVVHVGRFSAVKNHEFLLEVFAQLKKKKQEAFLLMVGRGKTEQDIRRKAAEYGVADSIKIFYDRTDVPEILRAADAAVFPSISEGLPLSVIEMQVAGLPCIVSTAVPKDACISNKICYMSLDEPSQKWAEELIRLAEDDSPICYNNLEAWDLNESVRRLGEMYKGEE